MARRSNIKRTYLASIENGEAVALYMMERGPGYLNDRALHEDGWVATLTLTDWRIGERNDIDIITRKAAKAFAADFGKGALVK